MQRLGRELWLGQWKIDFPILGFLIDVFKRVELFSDAPLPADRPRIPFLSPSGRSRFSSNPSSDAEPQVIAKLGI
jgi:hypothetical protein